MATVRADPGFFLGGGAPIRNDFNPARLMSFLLFCLFVFCRILLILESRRSPQVGERGTPSPPRP